MAAHQEEVVYYDVDYEDEEEQYLSEIGNKVEADLRTKVESSTGESSLPLTGIGIGIDLGTSNSAVSAIVNGIPVILTSNLTCQSRPQRTIPSAVAYGEHDDPILVGEAALNKTDDKNWVVFKSVKRVIGKTVSEALNEGQDLSLLHIASQQDRLREESSLFEEGEEDDVETILRNYEKEVNLKRGKPETRLDRVILTHHGKFLSPATISAQVLRTLKATAEHTLGTEVARAVIAVPAEFSYMQCRATESAGRMAGFERVKLLKEPEAAALAYGFDLKREELVLVFDLGGGTTDIAVLQVGDGVVEVVATAGDRFLGGDDFDAAMADLIVERVRSACEAADGAWSSQLAQSPTPTTKRRLKHIAEKAKIDLQNKKKVTAIVYPHEIGLAKLKQGDCEEGNAREGGQSVTVSVSRHDFAERVTPLVRRIMRPLREVALLADVLLAGEVGVPASGVTSLKEKSTKKSAEKLLSFWENLATPGSVVSVARKNKQLHKERRAKKAEKQHEHEQFKKAAQRMVESGVGTKIHRFPKGRQVDSVLLVGGGTKMICIRELMRHVLRVEPKTLVDPNEAVALGAAVHAGVMDGSIEGLEVLNPFSAGLLRFLHKEQK